MSNRRGWTFSDNRVRFFDGQKVGAMQKVAISNDADLTFSENNHIHENETKGK
jgi:hypothetical protein